MKPRIAVVSVSNKEGIVGFASGLAELGYEFVATGGTFSLLAEAGLPVRRVEEVTGFPEVLRGRVKTLHPAIHAGILARPCAEDEEELGKLGINQVDLVVANLYPFREAVAREDVTPLAALEEIDIGGVTLIRAAAKNFLRVGVVVSPDQYEGVLREMREQGGLSLKTRLELARAAFRHTALYEAAIASFFERLAPGEEGLILKGRPLFPEFFFLPLVKVADLRYGENPHQAAAFYREEGKRPSGLAGAKQLQGKELSYNNLRDLDAAFRLCREFEVPAAAVIKHATPCGVACASSLEEAVEKALAADPEASFGGIVGLNRPVDGKTALRLVEVFLEAVIAPAYDREALEVLAKKDSLRVLYMEELGWPGRELDVERVEGGLLVQEPDWGEAGDWNVVTKREPSLQEWEDLTFAWRVAKHVLSNAIVVARNRVTVGIGGGQVSRVGAARVALAQAGEKARGAVLASDGFLPFPDTVELAAAAGVTAVIQPGGSRRDAEVIARADAAGLAMVFTGRRHFRH